MSQYQTKCQDQGVYKLLYLLVIPAACCMEALLYGKPHAGSAVHATDVINDRAQNERSVAMMTECTSWSCSGCQVKHHCWVIWPYSWWSQHSRAQDDSAEA